MAKLSARGKQVDVDHVDVSSTVKKIFGRVNGVVVERLHTFGASDGPRPNVTLADIQKDFDTARQRVADEVAWLDDLNSFVSQLS